MTSFNPDAWKNADVNDFGDDNQPPEPGTYDVTVLDAAAFTSKAGNDIVKVEYQVLPNGQRWTVISGFKSDGATSVTKAMCSRLGVPIDDVSSLGELDTELNGIIGQYYEVAVRQNGEYTNTYVNNRITALTPASDVPADTSDFEPAAAPAGGSQADDDDIPF